MNSSTSPTEKERAYFAMIEYLEAYRKRVNSDEVAGMLGGMQFLPDGVTMDQACWADWEEAWQRTNGKSKSDYLSTLSK